MALYHCHIKLVQRSKGKSVVAAAAYRSGTKITNEWDGELHDYTKKGGIVHAEILLPQNAPPTLLNRSELWNSVELFEKQKDAQLARDIEIALPVELNRQEQIHTPIFCLPSVHSKRTEHGERNAERNTI